MFEKMAEALREVVRAKLSERAAQEKLWACEKATEQALSAVFEVGLIVGEMNVVSMDDRVFVVNLDCEDGAVAWLVEPEFVMVDAAVQVVPEALVDYVEGVA